MRMAEGGQCGDAFCVVGEAGGVAFLSDPCTLEPVINFIPLFASG
jgi:hypothetical protein